MCQWPVRLYKLVLCYESAVQKLLPLVSSCGFVPASLDLTLLFLLLLLLLHLFLCAALFPEVPYKNNENLVKLKT